MAVYQGKFTKTGPALSNPVDCTPRGRILTPAAETQPLVSELLMQRAVLFLEVVDEILLLFYRRASMGSAFVARTAGK
jgi:hypothetical protein